MKESNTDNEQHLYFQFQRLIIEEKETEKNAVDTATLMGGPKGKKGYYFYFNLFVTSTFEFSNSPILEFKVLHKSKRAL